MKHKHAMVSHMNQQQLAEYWGISARTLERWRSIGWGPRYIKIGGRVVYRLEDILEYEAEHLHEFTGSRSRPTAPENWKKQHLWNWCPPLRSPNYRNLSGK